jgi:hypothetical protein
MISYVVPIESINYVINSLSYELMNSNLSQMLIQVNLNLSVNSNLYY